MSANSLTTLGWIPSGPMDFWTLSWVPYNSDDHKWKVTASLVKVLQLREAGSPRSIINIKNKPRLNFSTLSSSLLFRWPSSPLFFLDFLLLLTYFKKPFSCLTPHSPVSIQVELCHFLISLSKYELQLFNLPVKTDLASRDHIFLFLP